MATIEAGVGFAFLGVVVGYLPVLYQSYSSREARINLLDAHAGSPPTAGELLLRRSQNAEKLEKQLADWEEWMAELLEEHLSYPMLSYFRSQHQNQAWLTAVIAMLDASAVVSLTSEGELCRQADATFAIGRRALADLATVFHADPHKPAEDRLPQTQLAELCRRLEASRTSLRTDRLPAETLSSLRELYEPYAYPLSQHPPVPRTHAGLILRLFPSGESGHGRE